MFYKLYREHHSEKTFNGYEDNPYWRLVTNFCDVCISDDGYMWSVNNHNLDFAHSRIQQILDECRLPIKVRIKK